MQFIRTNALLREARCQGIVGRDERAAATEWLKTYDEALDGRVDGGFFDFEVLRDVGMTINHPFSLKTEKAEGLQRLLNQMFLEAPSQDAPKPPMLSRGEVVLRPRQQQEPSFWEIGLMVLLALTPLTWAGCDSSEPLDCSACPNDLCYEGQKTLYPDAGEGDAALSTDAEAPVTVTGIICGCPPKSHLATCLPDEPGGKQYPCCVSDVPIDDPY